MLRSKTQVILSVLFNSVLAISTSSLSYALETDPQQPITIQADSATFSEADNRAIYQGAVELSQGSLKMTADILTIQNSASGVEYLTAAGHAHYSQIITTDKPPLEAVAEKILYYPHDQKMELVQSAHLWQGDRHFQGNHIRYDLKQRILSASGDIPNSKSKSTDRVKMVIPPSPKTQRATDATPPASLQRPAETVKP